MLAKLLYVLLSPFVGESQYDDYPCIEYYLSVGQVYLYYSRSPYREVWELHLRHNIVSEHSQLWKHS